MRRKIFWGLLITITLVTGIGIAFETATANSLVMRLKDGLSPQARAELAEIVEYFDDEEWRNNPDIWTFGCYCWRNPLDVYCFGSQVIEKEVTATDFAWLSMWQRQDLVISALRDSIAQKYQRLELNSLARNYFIAEMADYVHNLDPLCAMVKDGAMRTFFNYKEPTGSWRKALGYPDEHSLRASIDEMFVPIEQGMIKRTEALSYEGLSTYWGDDIVSKFFKNVGDFLWRLIEPLLLFLMQIFWVRLLIIEACVVFVVWCISYLGADFLSFTSRNS